MEDGKEVKSFKELGVIEQLIEACDSLGWKNPSKIQVEVIPHALEGNYLIGLGSGKTGAFALPILQALFELHGSSKAFAPLAFFACVLSPTRELAIQIVEQFEALGSSIGAKSVVVQKLQRACLRNSVKIEAASKYSTVEILKQQLHFVPAKYKFCIK